MLRPEVLRFVALGPLPASDKATEQGLNILEAALRDIGRSVSVEEARLLMGCFGPDDRFGAAWSLLHLIETSQATLAMERPPDDANEWVMRPWQRAENWRALTTRQ